MCAGAMRLAGEQARNGVLGDGEAATTTTTTDPRRWVTTFVNPDTQALEVRIFARPVDKDLHDWVIVADYMGFAGR